MDLGSVSCAAGKGAALGVPAAAAATAAAAAADVAPRGSVAREMARRQQPPERPRPNPIADRPNAAALLGRVDVSIRVWTLGLRFVRLLSLAPEWRDQLQADAQRSAFKHEPLPEGWPACFLVSGGFAAPGDRTVAVDTRVFKDPAGGAGKHLGFHGAVLQGLVRSRCNFGKFFKERVWSVILDAVAAGPRQGPQTIHVLSFCKSGRHRSVGIASLIREVARADTAWDVQLRHLSDSEWWHETCGVCSMCTTRSDCRKDEALAAARAAAHDAQRDFDAPGRGSRRGGGGGQLR